MKPVAIGIAVCLVAFQIGCARRTDVAVAEPNAVAPIQIGVIQSDAGAEFLRPPLVSDLPTDAESRRLGKKVYSKVPTSLFRNPRLNASETYRIPAGTALWVSPTQNPDWMRVRLARGGSAFVRTDATSAALALANARGSMADRARLSPLQRATDEADAGDGRSTSAPSANPELNDAIEDAVRAFDTVSQQMDRLSAEYAGFQGDPSDWPQTKDGFAAQLNQMATDMQAFGQALNEVSEHSSRMSSNVRSAFQAAVAQASVANDAIRSARTLLDQMGVGEDWSAEIQSLGERVTELGSAVNSIEASLERMG